ncbi:MAG: helix-turn-helix domain-containing protein [Deltaproteobacteria bacterium]|jgi:transcriptional regulator with XRE-family HTH domain|nr:helix-turn-helix domain-containing protein [Deltaproteobacteria bacterium]
MRTVRKKLSSVGVIIREFRQQANLSQDALADRMDMSTSYISMLESGKRYPSIEMLIRVAIALNASPGDMLNRIAERYAQHEQNRTDYPGDGASQGSLF